MKDKKIYKTPFNPDKAEIQDFDLAQANEKARDDFKKRYRDFYNDVKNTNQTEDW